MDYIITTAFSPFTEQVAFSFFVIHVKLTNVTCFLKKKLLFNYWITFALPKLTVKAHSHDLANPRGQKFDPWERFILTLPLIKINTRTAWSSWSQGTQHDPFLPLCPLITHWWLEETVHFMFKNKQTQVKHLL